MNPKRHSWRLAAALLLTLRSAQAASGAWSPDADGNWAAATNWTGSVVANGAGSTATFDRTITASRTVTLDSSRIIGNLLFGNAAAYNTQ